MIGLDDRRATGAARRQHEIKDRPQHPHDVIVAAHEALHKRPMTPPEIFDRNARRVRRRQSRPDGFIPKTMADDLIERLDSVRRRFSRGLIVGHAPRLANALTERKVEVTLATGDEDRLDLGGAQFDLVVSSGALDTVADLPGALILTRRALMPDGLFLANFAGASGMSALRAAIAVADGDNAIVRIHPQIDVRSAGDLLVRAGFALPVADVDTLDVAYCDFASLLTDLRHGGATNVLARRSAVSRRWIEAASSAFSSMAGPDGRTHETMSFITLTAWAPSPDQPRPAKRGSATTSLEQALRPAT